MLPDKKDRKRESKSPTNKDYSPSKLTSKVVSNDQIKANKNI